MEEEDFLAVANPELVLSFEEAERTFSLDKPKPSHHKLHGPQITHAQNSQPTGKRQRLCSVCHQPGHNKRSCTKRK